MARVDNLILKAGIQPGDRIEIFGDYWRDDENTGRRTWYEGWEAYDDPFYAVGNGRFYFRAIGADREYAGIPLTRIKDVRKVSR
jgi:hypothetical protein